LALATGKAQNAAAGLGRVHFENSCLCMRNALDHVVERAHVERAQGVPGAVPTARADGLLPVVLEGRGAYGAYFAGQVRVGGGY
jgi:hypothetical protein